MPPAADPGGEAPRRPQLGVGLDDARLPPAELAAADAEDGRVDDLRQHHLRLTPALQRRRGRRHGRRGRRGVGLGPVQAAVVVPQARNPKPLETKFI